RALLDEIDELGATDRLVRDDEDVLRHQWPASSFVAVPPLPPCAVAPAGCGTSAPPFKTPWTAPGTPYSYGPPTTVGTASKLKIGGGDETCHSSVCARQGLAGAAGPCRQLATML